MTLDEAQKHPLWQAFCSWREHTPTESDWHDYERGEDEIFDAFIAGNEARSHEIDHGCY